MKYILREAKDYKIHIIASFIFGAIWSISLILPPRLLANIIDIGIVKQDINYIFSTGLLMLLVTVINLISFLINIYLVVYISCGIAKNLRSDMYKKVMTFTKKEMDRFGVSTLVTRMTNDMNQLQNTVDFFLRKIFTLIITIAGSIILAFSIDKQLSALMLIIVPVLVLSSYVLNKKSIGPYQRIRKSLDKLNTKFKENISGAYVIRAFNKEKYQQEEFIKVNENVYTNTLRAERTMMLLAPIASLAMNLIVVVILWFASRKIALGTLQIGSLIAIIQYVSTSLQSIVDFTFFAAMAPRAKISVDRIEKVLDVKLEDEGVNIAQRGKCLEVKNLSFAYPKASLKSLCNINMTLAPGDTIALIGSTGSGKSTFLRLLLGTYKDESNAIYYGALPINEYENLDKIFSYVPQRSFLFQGSLRDNLLMAKEDASDEEMWKALEQASIDAYFRNENDGLDSYIAQGGSNLSGGQRQRLTIARALLKDADIYIFDDSFSALDAKSESVVRDNIKRVLEDKIVIIVGQRISSVKDADEIYVFEHGAIVGKGKHEYLLENNQVYQEILASQLSEEERR